MNSYLTLFNNEIPFLNYNRNFYNYNEDLYTTNSIPDYIIYKDEEKDNEYVIELAIIGLDKNKLEIKQDREKLLISSKKFTSKDKSHHKNNYLVKDIEKCFYLEENIIITDAVAKNGLLTIRLQNKIPSKDKPRTISVN